jgi:hypothetical protein
MNTSVINNDSLNLKSIYDLFTTVSNNVKFRIQKSFETDGKLVI